MGYIIRHLSTSPPSLEALTFLADEENSLYDMSEGAGLRESEEHKDPFDFAHALTWHNGFPKRTFESPPPPPPPPERLTVVL